MPKVIKNIAEWKKQEIQKYSDEVAKIQSDMNLAKEERLAKKLEESLEQI